MATPPVCLPSMHTAMYIFTHALYTRGTLLILQALHYWVKKRLEFTCPSSSAYNKDMLSVGDVYVDSHSDPSVVTVHLRRSKTNTLG